jgi:hypothetical protein
MEHTASIRTATTHPTTPERFLFLRKVTELIADKKHGNPQLVPMFKVIQAGAAHTATRNGNF